MVQKALKKSAEALLQELAMAVAHIPNVTVSSPYPNCLIVSRTYIARGKILIAVLLFPIGLLALFFKTTDTVTFTVTQDANGTSCKTFGYMSPEILAATDLVLGQGDVR